MKNRNCEIECAGAFSVGDDLTMLQSVEMTEYAQCSC